MVGYCQRLKNISGEVPVQPMRFDTSVRFYPISSGRLLRAVGAHKEPGGRLTLGISFNGERRSLVKKRHCGCSRWLEGGALAE